MKKAYSYVRFSSDIQGQGDSFRRQTELSQNYAKENGLELVETFEDLGVSAFKGLNRQSGGLGDFINAVKTSKIDKGSVLLVENLDRLSRDEPVEALIQLQEILGLGIEVVTLQDMQVYKKGSMRDAGKLFTSIAIMLRANEESEAKSKRLKAVWAEKRKEARQNIAITNSCPSWLRLNNDNKFEIISEHADIIKRMFEMACKGMGSPSIATVFNKEGIEPFTRSSKWYDTSIKHFLTNPSVIGFYQPFTRPGGRRGKALKSGEAIVNYYPAIISVEDFKTVQTLIENRQCYTSRGRRGSQFSNLFTGVIKCPICKEPMRYVDKRSLHGRNKYTLPYFQCRTYVLSKSCNAQKWKVHEFEESFFQFVEGFNLDMLFDDNNNSNDKRMVLQKLNNEVKALSIQHNKELMDLETNLGLNLNPLILQSLSKRIESLDNAIKSKQKEIFEIEQDLETNEARYYEQKIDDFKSLSSRLKGLNDNEKYKIRQDLNNNIKSLISSIYLYMPYPVDAINVYDESPDSVINSVLRNSMIAIGYTNPIDQESFLNTIAGQKLYNESSRYFVVVFKNSKKIWVNAHTATVFKY